MAMAASASPPSERIIMGKRLLSVFAKIFLNSAGVSAVIFPSA
jgi:hypothetical protein